MYVYLIPHRNEYLQKIKLGIIPTSSPPIDFGRMHKINSRTRFKLTKYCCICGANTKLQMHHIRPLKVKGVLGSGFRGFDKIVGALNRKQKTNPSLPILSPKHPQWFLQLRWSV